MLTDSPVSINKLFHDGGEMSGGVWDPTALLLGDLYCSKILSVICLLVSSGSNSLAFWSNTSYLRINYY